MPATFDNHCNNCPYNPKDRHSASANTRPPGPLNMETNSPDTLLIFQAPGSEEWAARKPICSTNPNSAAARIRNSLVRIGRSRTDFSITNSTQCYPGKGDSSRDKVPLTSARKCCSNWLKKDIEAFSFSRIVVFGAKAKKSITELGYDNDHRFQFLRHPSGGLRNFDLDVALKSFV
jgi:uracil-DNA glycosylase family 4